MSDESNDLTLDKLIADIELSRAATGDSASGSDGVDGDNEEIYHCADMAAAAARCVCFQSSSLLSLFCFAAAFCLAEWFHCREQRDKAIELVDGEVTYDELLTWFLDVGRSYLPPQQYTSLKELEEPTDEQLRALFDEMDDDNSGEVNEAEVKTGTLSLYPFLDAEMLHIAYMAADADASGMLAFDEFDELISCLQFLNKQRHSVEEMMENFGAGVDVDEFYIGLVAMGVAITDTQAKVLFEREVVRLQKERGFRSGAERGQLTADEYLLWVCRHECIEMSDEEKEKIRITAATEEVANLADESEFGDIYFEVVQKRLS